GGSAIRLHEEVEDAIEHVGMNSNPSIADGKHGVLAFAGDKHVDRAAAGRVFRGVGEQIGNDLLDAHAVGVDPNRIEVQLDAVIAQTTGQVESGRGTLDGCGEVDGGGRQGDLAVHDTRYIEQILHHAGQVMNLAPDHVARAHFVGLLSADPVQHLGGGCNGAQRVAQLMVEKREKF